MLPFLVSAAFSAGAAAAPKPRLHFIRPEVYEVGGWHDVAGAFTHKQVHHVWMGTGWNHASSNDLVQWRVGAQGPQAIHERHGGMDSETVPCSGFVYKDADGAICAGFRQCSSTKGVEGGAPWDVPLEVRCALDADLDADLDSCRQVRCALDADLDSWSIEPDYLFNVSWYRSLPYDPARPWFEGGAWYVLLAMDGCNATQQEPLRHYHGGCAAGGALGLWRTKQATFRGGDAPWDFLGFPFTSNATVLADAFLSREFVTIDYVGGLVGDVLKGATRVFFDNVGGNGGGDGCCSGTTSYRAFAPTAPGAPFGDPVSAGMVDWGAFYERSDAGAYHGVSRLLGNASRGFSMARTLGADDDYVIATGRRVLVGWVGPSPEKSHSAQSLPRDLELAQDSSLLQQFSPELKRLRAAEMNMLNERSVEADSPFFEVVARFTASSNQVCGVAVLADANDDAGVFVSLDAGTGLVSVDTRRNGNDRVRCGPLPSAGPDGRHAVHIFVDKNLVELIVDNATAFAVYAKPISGNTRVHLVGCDDGAATLDVFQLHDPQHDYGPGAARAHQAVAGPADAAIM